MNQEKIKTKIIETINEKPRLCQKITTQWLSANNGTTKFAELATLLNWDIAQLMMDWVSPEIWQKAQSIPLAKINFLEAGKEFIQTVIAMELTWEETNLELDDPFEKIKLLSNNDKTELLNQFTPEEWALTSAFWEREELLNFAKNFNASNRRSFIVGLERLKKVPKENLLSASIGFSNRVNLAMENYQAPETEPSVSSSSKTYVVYPGENIKKVEAAIDTFVEINEKESEIEAKISKYFEKIDPELNAQLNQILQGDDYE